MTRGREPTWATDEEYRELLQRRLKTLLAVVTVSVLVAFVVHVVMLSAIPEARTDHPRFILAVFVAASVLGCGTWYALHRAPRSMRVLHGVDLGFAVFASAAYGLALYLLSRRLDEVYFAVVYSGMFLLGRALFVPSSTRRTLAISVLWSAPVFGSAVALAVVHPERLMLPPATFVINLLFQCGVPVVLAGVGAWVINGLRRDVREARRLGQYTLGEKIGEGGMGAVYRAHHALLRRPTAIKLLPGDKAGAQAIRRFEREVQLTAELTDPHVVAVYDYGRSNDGTFYYAMELLDGLDLETLVRRFGPQPSGRVIHILCQACDALEEAHERGLIHRDIKPANIILCRRGVRADWVKVLDFGLVKDMARDEGDTKAGTLQGTPKYISPEAISDPESVGAHSDIYALGAVGYFLVTGTPVFDGKTIVDVCSKHLHETPEPPSARCGQPVPAALEAVLLRCLSKRPGDRPASAAALRDELGRIRAEPAWGDADIAAWWAELGSVHAAHAAAAGADRSILVDLHDR